MRRYRNAITGRFVTAWYALRHPRTTISTRIEQRRKLPPLTQGDREKLREHPPVYHREECVFRYCPCPRVCEPANRCVNPLRS